MPNDPDVNQIMAVFDKLSRSVDTARDESAMAINSLVQRAQEIILERNAEIERLRAQINQLTNELVAERVLAANLRTQVDHLDSLASIMSDPIFAEKP